MAASFRISRGTERVKNSGRAKSRATPATRSIDQSQGCRSGHVKIRNRFKRGRPETRLRSAEMNLSPDSRPQCNQGLDEAAWLVIPQPPFSTQPRRASKDKCLGLWEDENCEIRSTLGRLSRNPRIFGGHTPMGLDGLDSTPVNLNIEENHKPLKKNNRIGCDQDQNKNNPGGEGTKEESIVVGMWSFRGRHEGPSKCSVKECQSHANPYTGARGRGRVNLGKRRGLDRRVLLGIDRRRQHRLKHVLRGLDQGIADPHAQSPV